MNFWAVVEAAAAAVAHGDPDDGGAVVVTRKLEAWLAFVPL